MDVAERNYQNYLQYNKKDTTSMNYMHTPNSTFQFGGAVKKPEHEDTGYMTGGYDNVGSESESDTEEPVGARIAAAVALIKPQPKKRKMDPLDQSIQGIKRLCTDAEMIARVQSFYFSLEEEKRKTIGNLIHWQASDETATRDAMLDDTINIIMQARKAMMSRTSEGVKITIEQGGYDDPETCIRPKYSIVIERVKA